LQKINLFVAKYFLIYFFFIFISLSSFFVGIDFILNSDKITDSANIKVLYLLNSFLYSISIITPISILFAYIIFWLRFLKHSELIAIYSLGFDKKAVLKPILLTSILISITSIALNFTEVAYSKDNMRNILDKKFFTDSKSNIFVKNMNNYIFIKKMYIIQKQLEDITIFEYQNKKLHRIIKANSAKFIDNIWRVKDATIYIPPVNMQLDINNRLDINTVSEIDILKGFKPAILDNISEQKISLSISDALNTFNILQQENISTNKIRGILYGLVLFPMFSTLLLVILFYFSPISSRLSNSIKTSSIFVFISLIAWGLFYSFSKFSSSATLNPEFGFLLPMMILFGLSAYVYRKL
jgi:lipopolysaccharide export system permease protein